MATTSNTYNAVSSVTEFKKCVQAISDGLTAAGFPKTADTGQVNIAGITTTPAYNNWPHWEVRAFSGPHQATAPVFFRIEYGAGSGNMQIRYQFGGGTDGAGGLTGLTTSQQWINGSSGSNNMAVRVSGDGTYCNVWFTSPTVAIDSFGFAFDRLRELDGSVNPIGVHYLHVNSGVANVSGIYTTGGVTPPATVTPWPFANPAYYASQVVLDVALCAAIIPYGKPYTARHLLIMNRADIPVQGTVVQVPIDGSTHNYIVLSDNVAGGISQGSANFTGGSAQIVTAGVLARWE